MMFCPKCGSMLRPKTTENGKVMACSCGFVDRKPTAVRLEANRKKDEINYDVVEETQSAYPVIEAECPKCKNNKAMSWTQQMRAGDEPETHFLRCTKCDHTWREGK